MLTYILSRLYIYIILHARYNIIQLGTYLLFQYLIHIILDWGKVRHRFYTIDLLASSVVTGLVITLNVILNEIVKIDYYFYCFL